MLFHKALAASGGESKYWLAQFSSTTNFWPFDVAVDSQDNIIAVGRTSEDGAGGTDAIIMKFDKSGNELWSKTYGDASLNQRFHRVHIDSSDNIYVAGQTHSLESDGLWMKLDSDGVIQIEQTLSDGTGTYSFESCYDIKTDDSGNIYVFAELERNNGSGLYCYILLYNSSGTLLDSDYLNHLAYAADHVLATRTPKMLGDVNSDGSRIPWSCRSGFNGNEDMWFGVWSRNSSALSKRGFGYKLDANDTIAGNSYGQPTTASFLDSSDNIYYFTTDSLSGSDAVVIYKATSGTSYLTTVARRALGYFNNFQFTAAEIDVNDNIYVGTFYGYVTKLDTSLNVINTIYVTNGTNNFVTGLAGLSDGTVAVCGRGLSGTTYVARLDTNGDANGTYGSWTVGSTTLTTSTSVNGLIVETTYGVGFDVDDTIATQTDPNYTEASATITYTKY